MAPRKCIRVHFNNSRLKSNYVLVFLAGALWINSFFYALYDGLFKISQLPFTAGGTRWCSWLRYYVTSRQVAVSIPDGIVGTFRWLNPSGRTMTLGSTQSLTQMITRDVSWGTKAAVSSPDSLTAFISWLSSNSGCLKLQKLKPPIEDFDGTA